MKNGDILVHKLNENFKVIYIGTEGIGFKMTKGTQFTGRYYDIKKNKIKEDVFLEEEFKVLETEKTRNSIQDSENNETMIGIICPNNSTFKKFIESNTNNSDIIKYRNSKECKIIHSLGNDATVYIRISCPMDCRGLTLDTWKCVFCENDYDRTFIDSLPKIIDCIIPCTKI